MPEQYVNVVKTTVSNGGSGYAFGASSLKVASTTNGTVTGFTGAFPTSGTFTVGIVDAASQSTLKAQLTVTAVTNGTTWAVSQEIAGSAADGDIVIACWWGARTIDQLRADMSQYGANGSLPAVTYQKQGNQYKANDAPYDYLFNGSSWDKYVRGGVVLLEQHTASSSATLDFTTCITSAFDDYVVELIELTPATDGTALLMRVSTDGGSTFDSGSNYANAIWIINSSGGSGVDSTSGSSFQIYGTSASNISSRGGISGKVYVHNPLSAKFHSWNLQLSHYGNDAVLRSYSGGVVYKVASAVNALRFLFSSGNIASGIIRCYGIAKGYTI